MIDLCNRTGLDLWLCIPHKTFDDFRANPTDNYWTSLAKLVKEQLNPSLNVYVEYSNETWNSAGYYSAQYNNCIQMAGQLGLSGGDCDFAQ